MITRLVSPSCIYTFLSQWAPSPLKLQAQINPFSPKVLLPGYLSYYSNSEVTSTYVFISLCTQEWNFWVIKYPAFWRTAKPIAPQLYRFPHPHPHHRGCWFILTHRVSFYSRPGDVKWHLIVVLWLPKFDLFQFKSYYSLLIFCLGFFDLCLKMKCSWTFFLSAFVSRLVWLYETERGVSTLSCPLTV